MFSGLGFTSVRNFLWRKFEVGSLPAGADNLGALHWTVHHALWAWRCMRQGDWQLVESFGRGPMRVTIRKWLAVWWWSASGLLYDDPQVACCMMMIRKWLAEWWQFTSSILYDDDPQVACCMIMIHKWPVHDDKLQVACCMMTIRKWLAIWWWTTSGLLYDDNLQCHQW